MTCIGTGIKILFVSLILAALPVVVNAASYEDGHSKVINENYNGKTIQVKQGENLYLKLKENPSTGYSWILSQSNGLNLLSTEYHPPAASKLSQRVIVGAAGFHSWKIKAIAKGSLKLKAIYRRPWEKETGREQTFILNIKVV